MNGYDMPDSLQEIFEVGETQWTARDYIPEMEMDNVEAMAWFMDFVGISPEDCESIEDTQIIVKHTDYTHKLCIDSGGLGDFFSHAFEVSIVEEATDD